MFCVVLFTGALHRPVFSSSLGSPRTGHVMEQGQWANRSSRLSQKALSREKNLERPDPAITIHHCTGTPRSHSQECCCLMISTPRALKESHKHCQPFPLRDSSFYDLQPKAFPNKYRWLLLFAKYSGCMDGGCGLRPSPKIFRFI